MNKYKINYTIAAILLVASFFAGWQTMLIVGALLFIFCEVGDKLKDLSVNLISFSIGIKLVEILWGIIYKASSLIPSILEKLTGIINYYLDSYNKISLTKLKLYVINPIKDLFDIGNDIFGYLITIASFVFITSLLIGKNKKGFVVGNYISGYVDKILNYISEFNTNEYTSQPVSNQTKQVVPNINTNNQILNNQVQNQNINNIQANNNIQNYNDQSNSIM